MATLVSSKEVKIRKPRKCGWCWDQFNKGDKMRVSFNVDGGDAWSFYNCAICSEIIKFAEHEYDGYDEGYVYEWMQSDNFVGTKEQFLAYLKAGQPPSLYISKYTKTTPEPVPVESLVVSPGDDCPHCGYVMCRC